MFRYRELSAEELQELEPEFIQFLVLNGITASDWIKIKDSDLNRTEELIHLFSDVIMEGVLSKINFLQFRDKTSIRCFQCLEKKIVMVSLETSDHTVDLLQYTNGSSIPSHCSLSTLEKEYHPERSLELWKMLQSGCEISDGTTFKALCLGL